jgi:hypothetical protein
MTASDSLSELSSEASSLICNAVSGKTTANIRFQPLCGYIEEPSEILAR